MQWQDTPFEREVMKRSEKRIEGLIIYSIIYMFFRRIPWIRLFRGEPTCHQQAECCPVSRSLYVDLSGASETPARFFAKGAPRRPAHYRLLRDLVGWAYNVGYISATEVLELSPAAKTADQ